MNPQNRDAPNLHPERRIRFDGTINAGHVISLGAMLVTLFVGWSALDKRVVILETTTHFQTARDKAQDDQIAEKFGAIKESISELKRTVEQSNNAGKGK
jgi:hypothetical protein